MRLRPTIRLFPYDLGRFTAAGNLPKSGEMADCIGRNEDAICRFGERYLSCLINHLLIDFGPELPRVLQLSDAAHGEEDWLVKDALPVLLYVFTVWIIDRLTALDAL